MNHQPPSLLLTRPLSEPYACTELPGDAADRCSVLALGVVLVPDLTPSTLTQHPLFFTRQLLPAVQPVGGASIRLWAHDLYEALIPHLEESGEPWALHIFEPLTVTTGLVYARQRHIAQELLALLDRRRRALLKRKHQDPAPLDTLVQVCCTTPTQGFLSVTPAALRSQLHSRISPACAGYVEIEDDPTPPSRAYKKLREACKVFNLRFEPRQRCVDLGAAPGGWTAVALQAGCSVTAVDRSPLASSLARAPRLTTLRADAHSWVPPHRIDWLLCDVITTPDRTLELLERWLSRRLCSNFCVTVKFKGAPDLTILSKLRTLLNALCGWWDGKQLTSNKNELTVVGSLPPSV
jgi:23S rRNA (cytidine2498-2'-O)-methyltransferase